MTDDDVVTGLGVLSAARAHAGIPRAWRVPYDAQMAEAAASARADFCPKLALATVYHAASAPCNPKGRLQGAAASRLNPSIAMFLEAFGLARDPFVDTADPAFYYDTLPGAHARRRLADALAHGRGLAVVVGPIGAGKTSLFNAVQHDLLADDRYMVASILDPTFADESEMLVAIADAFGFDIDGTSAPRALKDTIKHALFEAASQGVQPVLFIDEAQLLPAALLEPLRTMLNFQLDDRKLLCIALSGQMELASTIAASPNVSDRVSLWIELGPLSPPEAAGLLHHRLRCAGFSGAQSPFEDEALHELWEHSRGLPRRLTTLARESMEIAAEYARMRVRASDVRDSLGRVAPARGVRTEQLQASTSANADSAARPWWQWWRRAS